MIADVYGLSGKVAVLTGGAGVLCSEIAHGLAEYGVKLAILDIAGEAMERLTSELQRKGAETIAIKASVLNKQELEEAARQVLNRFSRVDILINGAGGNQARATTSPELPFFDLPEEAIRFVFDLNFMGTFLASQVFAKIMAKQGEGVILNISSMNAFRPLTRIPAYSAAKAAVSNFTQWLAVHMSQNYSPKIRVNAIAPGFFITEQNRYLLLDENGQLTERGRRILEHTPMGRFGEPKDLMGTVLWLVSPMSEFVHGVIIPIDGGFSAYSGV
jgi:NAD(P)-dependent dehydrogenase (short-subunit alcohol dehydrogenase family)